MERASDASKLTVYLGGMVFFDGCHSDDKKALLPNGSNQEHHASLWFRSADVDPSSLPPNLELRVHERSHDDGSLIEISIHGPVGVIAFPDENDSPAHFVNLEEGLAKLKKKGTGDPFPVDPQNADTIAVIPIRGGTLTATHAGNDGLVVWQIDHWATVQVTISTTTYTFIFEEGLQPELFLSNTCGHDSAPGDEHYQIYKRLNLGETADIEKPQHPGPPEHLSGFARDVLKLLRKRGEGDGETPTCCR